MMHTKILSVLYFISGYITSFSLIWTSTFYLKSLGIYVVIIDHHQLTTELSENCLLINPHVNDLGRADSGWFDLSASGLVFKFLHGLIKHRKGLNDRIANEIKLSQRVLCL